MKIISFFTCIAILLSLCTGCSGGSTSDSSSSADMSSSVPDDVETGSEHELAPFTVLYNPSSSINPMVCTDLYNSVLDSLIYETLFTLDESFEPIPLLVEEYSTVDGITYSFTIKEGVYFHDGTEMTAEDVAYSIRQASYSGKYSSRLKDFYSAAASDTYSLTVTLQKANYRFASLLDIPVIKNLSVGEDIPSGTGPYVYTENAGSAQLTAFNGYRDYNELPVDRVLLKEYNENNVVSEFSAGKISLMPADPTGAKPFQIRIDHEARYYGSSVMQYVGFNLRTGKSLLLNPSFRMAVGYAIDRDKIVSDIFNGYADKASLALHPALGFYDTEWETGSEYSLQSASSLLSSLGFEDCNGDGWLEYTYSSGYDEVSLSFIVNADNGTKVDAAKYIVGALNDLGLNVTLSILSWDEYVYALSEGNFDLYYAETRLTADFDLSSILSSDGAVNYCGVSDARYTELINAYLSAEDDEQTAAAAGELAEYIRQDSAIIPILFKEYSVLSQRDMISGIRPTQSNILSGFIGSEIK